MNVFDLLIGNTGQALQLVFQLGFLPVEENFLELTDEQYRQFSAEVGGVDEKLYMIVTSNGQDILDDDYNEISVVTESEKNGFLNATAIIKKYCADKNLASDKEKLCYSLYQAILEGKIIPTS